jgi:hypothetical protein
MNHNELCSLWHVHEYGPRSGLMMQAMLNNFHFSYSNSTAPSSAADDGAMGILSALATSLCSNIWWNTSLRFTLLLYKYGFPFPVCMLKLSFGLISSFTSSSLPLLHYVPSVSGPSHMITRSALFCTSTPGFWPFNVIYCWIS